MYKLLKIKHLSVRSALPLALARTSIHRRWINFFLNSDNSHFDTSSFCFSPFYLLPAIIHFFLSCYPVFPDETAVFAFPVLYPFVVQVSLAVLFFSILMVVFLTPRLAWDKYNNARKEKFYAKLRNRYGDILLKIFADKHNYTDEEVLEMTNFKDEGWSGWRMFFVGRLMVETKSKVYDDYNYHNVEAAVRVFGLYGYA